MEGGRMPDVGTKKKSQAKGIFSYTQRRLTCITHNGASGERTLLLYGRLFERWTNMNMFGHHTHQLATG